MAESINSNGTNIKINDTYEDKSYNSDITTSKSNIYNNTSNEIEELDLSVYTYYDDLTKSDKDAGATLVVGYTSILSGIADLVEEVVDGITWTKAKVSEGVSYIYAKVLEDTGNKEKAQEVWDWREEMKESTAKAIAVDWVGIANEMFYEHTDIGKAINEASSLKYDSESAQKIRNESKKISELLGATVITMASGGALTFAVGFTEGIGREAEKKYQTSLEENGIASIDNNTGGILLTGLGNGISWYGLGQAGKGIANVGRVIDDLGLKSVASCFRDSLVETNLKDKLKHIFTKNNAKTFGSKGNIVDSFSVIADDIADYVNGDKELTAENIKGSLGEVFRVGVINFVTGGLSSIKHVAPTGVIETVIDASSQVGKNVDLRV